MLHYNNSPANESESLRSFIKDVGLPLNLAPEALGISSSDFMKWWSGHSPDLIQFKNLESLSRYFNIFEDEIMKGDYNKDVVRSLIFGNASVLPERYSQNQFSYLRSSAHILKYLARTRGQHFSDRILHQLSVSPHMYNDISNKISLCYFIDLLGVLAQNGVTQDELDSLACMLFLSIGHTELGQKFKNAKTYYQCYSVVAENMFLLESNFDYSFELTKNTFEIRSHLSYDKHFHVDWSQQSLDKLLRYRMFVAGCFPYLSNLPPIIPQSEIKYEKGGVSTRYVMNFSHLNLLFSK